MSTLIRTASRTLLASVAVVSLLAACGGDDDPADPTTTTTTEAPDEPTDEGASGDLCERLSLERLNDVTGEEFVNAEVEGEDGCRYSSADGLALIQLGVATLGEDDDFLGDAEEGCDDGTFAEADVDGADAAFACTIDGAPAVAAADGDDVTVLVGLSLDPAVSQEMILAALTELIADAI